MWKKIKECFVSEKKRNILFVIISAATLVLSLTGALKNMLSFDIAWVAIVLCGIPIVAGAAKALIKEHDIKADVLVSIALIASVWIGEYFAAGEVALIMQIGTLLEDFTANRARRGIEKLIKLTPQTAKIRRGGNDMIIPAAEVILGDIITVLAGETVPVDGIIVSGETSIDQSIMTGESIPVDKKVGDEVTSGTINQFSTFEMKAMKECKDSSLQRMIQLAEEADANKAPIVSLADKWATWMVIAALTISVITGFATGEIIRAVTVLVVFCPCAFILATPTAIMAGIGNATKFGILIRSGDALERLSNVQYIAFDKTGTLTYGKPQVVGVVSSNEIYSEDNILRLTALAEQRSEHPLGKAILEYYTAQGGELCEVQNFQMIAGMGINATVDGKTILAGKPDLFSKERIEIPAAASEQAKSFYSEGATVICIAVNGTFSGFIALADTVRPDAKPAIEKLKENGITPLLLTGDNEAAAHSIASHVGITQVKSNLLPEDKMEIIMEFNKQEKHVCMIGDGVNDALALSTAYAGVAMGGVGSDIAVESADAVLVSDDVKRLPYLFRALKKVMKKVNQNIIISLSINLVAVVLATLGVLNPVTGALMHNCGSVFVVVNAALLLREKDNI